MEFSLLIFVEQLSESELEIAVKLVSAPTVAMHKRRKKITDIQEVKMGFILDIFASNASTTLKLI